MKLKGLILAVAAVTVQFVWADLLLWQVGGDGVPADYTYATIKKNTSNSYDGATTMENVVPGSSASETVNVVAKDVFDGSKVAGAVAGSDYSGQYFFVELYGDDDNLLGRSTIASAQDLNAYFLAAAEIGANFSPDKSWAKQNWSQDVPEPTSGLLLLVGAAMLGLRRKKLA